MSWLWDRLFRPDPEDKERLEQVKRAKEKLDQLHEELVQIHIQSEIVGKDLKESRERNNYGESVMEAFRPKKSDE